MVFVDPLSSMRITCIRSTYRTALLMLSVCKSLASPWHQTSCPRCPVQVESHTDFPEGCRSGSRERVSVIRYTSMTVTASPMARVVHLYGFRRLSMTEGDSPKKTLKDPCHHIRHHSSHANRPGSSTQIFAPPASHFHCFSHLFLQSLPAQYVCVFYNRSRLCYLFATFQLYIA